MTATRDLSPLGALVLLWLSTQKEGKGARGDLNKILKPILHRKWSDSEQRSLVEDEIATLERAGQLSLTKRSSLRLTDEGRRAGLTKLGVTALPGKGDWKAVKKQLLASALGLSLTTKSLAKRVFDGADSVRAMILKQRYALNVGDNPTLSQAANALAWREFGVFDTKEKFTLKAVLTRLLNREHGTVKSQKKNDNVPEQLAAKAVGAMRTDASVLEMAVFHRWVTGVEVVPPVAESHVADGVAVAAQPAVPAGRAPVYDDKAFAERVLTAARTSPTGRFGENKVFISHVFRKLLEEGAIAADSNAFKDRLVAVHRAGFLSLSRADLVGAMDANDVDSSEARYLGATFHFVRI